MSQMGFDIEHTVDTLPADMQFDQIITLLELSLIPLRIDGCGIDADVTLFERGALPMLMAKKVNRGTRVDTILNLVLIHAPVGRVMGKDQMDHITFKGPSEMRAPWQRFLVRRHRHSQPRAQRGRTAWKRTPAACWRWTREPEPVLAVRELRAV
jgi:hypothetical protein